MRDVEKQEKVVSVLWDFAHAVQTMPPNAHTCKRVSDGTAVRLDDVGIALKDIMATFGHEVTPID